MSPTADGSLLRGQGERGRALAQEAVRCLAQGRTVEAVEIVGRVRRAPLGVDTTRLALVHADALLGLRRHTEAVHVSERALRRRPRVRDLRARLRLQRGQALWLVGRAAPGRAELRRAAIEAESPLTSARAHEIAGAVCGAGLDAAEARVHLDAARQLYALSGSTVGLARVLEFEERLERDAGRLEETLEIQDRRVSLLGGTTRVDLLASARNDRGFILTLLGRFDAAREDLDAAGSLFRCLGDPRERSLVSLSRAAFHIVSGECDRAREILGHAERAGAWAEAPAGRAESLLLLSDAALAEGDREPAAEAALQAVHLFGLVEDRGGVCRARTRRSHALLALGRPGDAVREAQRAREAASGRRGLETIADLALGRSLLRGRRAEAAAVFQRVRDEAAHRPDVCHAAQLGQWMAAGCGARDPQVAAALRGLEAWGDRRLLAACLADIRDLTGQSPDAFGLLVRTDPGGATVIPPAARGAEAAFEAALAFAAPGDALTRWAAAMHALRPAFGWWRAAILGREAWEIRADRAEPRPLPEDDIARDLAPRAAEGALSVRLIDSPDWRSHPSRTLYRLDTALLAPAGAGRVLYVDTREGEPVPGPRAVAVLERLGRLVELSWPEGARPERRALEVPGILGECAPMRTLVDMVHRFARTELPVHITGETGTGKEAVAAAVHALSRRSGARFIPVNASTYSDEVFQSEMFGHVRGAFTGASPHRDGLVVDAHGGTLFLDEVADLSAVTQSQLLRFLQEKEFRRLGENTVRRADVRTVTATNVPLEERVRNGRFREDLLYRLNALVLALPPLRDRGGDVLLLAEHFLDKESERQNLGRPTIGTEVRRIFESYAWPGNVRELQNEAMRLVTMAGSGRAMPEHLSPRILRALDARRGSGNLKEAVLAYERDVIVRTLEQSEGRRGRTAARLGLSRQALLEKMKRLGLC